MFNTHAPSIRHHLDIWHSATRDGLISLLPLTFLGVMAVLLNQPLPDGTPAWLAGAYPQFVRSNASLVLAITQGVMGLAAAHAIAYRAHAALGTQDTPSAPSAHAVGALASVAFLAIVVEGVDPSYSQLGYQNIIQGILAAFVTVEMVHFLHRKTHTTSGLIGLDSGTSLHKAIRLTWMGLLVLACLILFKVLAIQVLQGTQGALLKGIDGALHLFGQSPTLMNLALVAFNQLMWVAGLNGGQLILSWSSTAPNLPIASASVLWSDTEATPMFLNAFAHLGGAGATWGLIVAILVQTRDPGLRRLALMSVIPAAMNVNELLLFGIPLILSRQMVVPFVVAPMGAALVAQGALSAGLITLQGSPVNWSTPILISGYTLTQSATGALIQLLGVIAASAIYLPYVRQLESQRKTQLHKEFQQAIDILIDPHLDTVSVLNRTDRLGDISRRLLLDFDRDMQANRIRVAYQPQVDKNGLLIGVEALLRWRHPVYGQIPPEAVVSVAEECDVIHDLGFWVTRQVCSDLCEWKHGGQVGFKVSINISAVQLEHPRYVDCMQAILESYGIEPSDIELEITERKPIKSTDITENNLNKIQRAGYHLSMDDFGMGATSLLLMQRFKLRSIKLDKCLTQGIETQHVNQSIIRAVTRLARQQGIKTIAEFVDTETQRDCLANLGCDIFQGWLYSRAVSAAELLEFIESMQDKIHWPVILSDLAIDSELTKYFDSLPASSIAAAPAITGAAA